LSKDLFNPFDRELDPQSAPTGFRQGILPQTIQAPGWEDLATGQAPVAFVAPTWEVPGSKTAPSPAGISPPTTLQDQVAALLLGAEQEAQRLKDEAYAAGFAAGEQQGFAAGQQRVQALIDSLGQALQEVGRLRAAIFAQSEGEMLELALAIARKVLHHEGGFHRDNILALMRAGITKVTQRQELHIKVHPADLLFAMSCKAQLVSYVDGLDTILFTEDEAVPPGSCVVETPTEIIDLRWDEQLEEIAASLFETYERARRGDAA
jgi:flagellar assembly protein FliH